MIITNKEIIGTKTCNEKTFDNVKSFINSPPQKKSKIFFPKKDTEDKMLLKTESPQNDIAVFGRT